RQLRRTLQKSRRARPPTAAARPCGVTLELRCYPLVGTYGRLSQVPGAPVTIELGIAHGRERGMRLSPRRQRRSLVDGGANQRPVEHDTRLEGEQLPDARPGCGLSSDSESLGRPPQ